ncbi:MAG TPA: hypothetical protein PLK38_06075 [Methanoregulaceae archaeon]|nr:hypothetical protein [Methanoregulaceae archaeon]
MGPAGLADHTGFVLMRDRRRGVVLNAEVLQKNSGRNLPVVQRFIISVFYNVPIWAALPNAISPQ